MMPRSTPQKRNWGAAFPEPPATGVTPAFGRSDDLWSPPDFQSSGTRGASARGGGGTNQWGLAGLHVGGRALTVWHMAPSPPSDIGSDDQEKSALVKAVAQHVRYEADAAVCHMAAPASASALARASAASGAALTPPLPAFALATASRDGTVREEITNPVISSWTKPGTGSSDNSQSTHSSSPICTYVPSHVQTDSACCASDQVRMWRPRSAKSAEGSEGVGTEG
eukprot:303468-Prorocentrum_minimum.AAC.1